MTDTTRCVPLADGNPPAAGFPADTVPADGYRGGGVGTNAAAAPAFEADGLPAAAPGIDHGFERAQAHPQRHPGGGVTRSGSEKRCAAIYDVCRADRKDRIR